MAMTVSLAPMALPVAAPAVRPQAGGPAAAALTARPGPAAHAPDGGPSSVLRLGVAAAAPALVYDKPAIAPVAAWERPPQDAISRLLQGSSHAIGARLADTWKGLAGALLGQLAATGEGYSQSLITAADPALPLAQQLAGLQRGAVSVSLQLHTRSGQTIQLSIASNDGTQPGAVRGLQVQVDSSAPLGAAERQALAALSGGVERVLAGLGDGQEPVLDLEELLGADRSLFARLELQVSNPAADKPALRNFALHLSDAESRLALEGASGRLAVRVDGATPLAASAGGQRQAAIARLLEQVDAAAERGHAGAALVGLFKSGLAQLHGASPADSPATAGKPVQLAATLPARVRELVSGLADFDAEFSGDTVRTNRFGAVSETGHAAYRLSQETELRAGRNEGDASVVQTQRAQLTAHWLKARNEGMLIPEAGNHDIHRVQEDSLRRTTIDAVQGELVSALREDSQAALRVFIRLVEHRETQREETPDNHYRVTQLV